MTWVLFDYGRVISQPPSEADLAALAAAAGTQVPALLEHYWRWRRAYDLAELDAPGYWRQIGTALGQDYCDDVIAELVRLDNACWLRLADGTVALIEELAAAGHPLALLSNAPAEIAAAVTALPLASRFKHLLFSCFLAAAKPEPRCYALALARLGASAEEVIFIDDRTDNIEAAAGLGISSVHFTDPVHARSAVF